LLYVMSDLHGEYEKYVEMLRKIHFSDEDTLYILGDVVDRGPEPVRLLKKIAGQENVRLIKGNHEGMAAYVLRMLNTEITEENAESHLTAPFLQALSLWQKNGGDVTLRAFSSLPPQERTDLLDVLEDTPLYDIAEAGGKTFLLVHSGLGNFHPEKKLRDYTFDEMTCMRPDEQRQYFSDPSVFIVCGHTPTRAVTGKDEICFSHHNILIDCGAVFGGKLACLCLDTMQAYYV